MDAEDLVAAQADPQPLLPHICEHCKTRHRWPISAAMCCDNVSFDLGYD